MRKQRRLITLILMGLVLCGAIFAQTPPGQTLKAKLPGGTVSSFKDCGCGVCGQYDEGVTREVIQDKQEFDNLLQAKQARTSQSCATVGCSTGCRLYVLET